MVCSYSWGVHLVSHVVRAGVVLYPQISHASPRWANQAIAMDEILQLLVTPVLLLATSHWAPCRTVSDASLPYVSLDFLGKNWFSSTTIERC